MENYQTDPDSIISLNGKNGSVSVDLYSDEGFRFLSNLWIKAAAERRLMYESYWLDRQIIQFPTDIVGIQELIWRVKPDIIIETGVAHGGSLILSASILELLGHGKVIGVDIDIRKHNRTGIEAHFLSKRVELVEGSSVASSTIARVEDIIGDSSRVLVFLDSDHSEDHVFQELTAYSKFVPVDSYIVAHDGAQAWVSDIPSGKVSWQYDNPLGAINKFLASRDDFEIDNYWTRWGITSSPLGYLRRR